MEEKEVEALESPFLTAQEAAHYLRLRVRTLDGMRWRGEGPCWRKHGGTVVYHRDDLNDWSRSREANPTVRIPQRAQSNDGGAR